MILPGIRCIFLDIGRVLVDIEIGLFGKRMMELAAVQPEQLRAAVMNEGLATAFETGRISEVEFHKEVCRRLGKEIAQTDFYEAWNSIFLPEPILSSDLVSSLAKKADLWALSNTNSVHHDFLAGHYDLFRFFTGQILSYKIGFQKPDDRIFRRALDQAGVNATDALFVDDQQSNVEGARGVGIDAFQFVTRSHFVEEMHARHLID